MTARTIDVIPTDECYLLLDSATVGRIAFVDQDGPVAIPVNFAVVDGDIVFRTEATSGLRTGVDHQVGFEADRIDPEAHSGWSVLARGFAYEVPAEEVPEMLAGLRERFPRPWAAGVHNTWVRIEVQAVTGRRLSSPHDPDVL